MRHSSVLAMIFVVTVLQGTFCNPIVMNFDMYKKNRYQIEAKPYENDKIQLVIQYLVKPSHLRIEYTPFMSGQQWYGPLYKYHETFLQPGNLATNINSYILHYKTAINNSPKTSPCMRVDKSNNTLCHLRVCISDTKYDYREVNAQCMPLYLKIQDSTAERNATLELFGGSSIASDDSDISQENEFVTLQRLKEITLKIKQHTADSAEPNRYFNMTYRHVFHENILPELRPWLYYFDCTKFQKLVEVQETRVLLAMNGTSINLQSLGLPFDDKVSCQVAVIANTIHNGNNLILVKADELVNMTVNPNLVKSSDPEKYPQMQRLTELTEKVKQLEEELRIKSAALKDTQVKFDKLRTYFNNGIELTKGDEVNSHQQVRSLVGRITRSLISRVMRQA